MARANATVEVRAKSKDVLDHLRDYSGWSSWMPGVAAAKPLDGGVIEWSIATPAGELQVPLEFVDSDGEIHFRRSGDADNPFSVLEGRVTVDATGPATTIALEMEMETRPPAPPAAIVSMLVSQALSTLSRRLPAAEEVSAPPETESLEIEMSDGAVISALRYPTTRMPAPAVLLFIPYRKEATFTTILGQTIAAAGFDFVIADVRGFGGSNARYEGLLSDREITDGVELIEWIAKQDFCDGKIATMGASYTGANQVLFAARKPAALKCIAPWDLPVDTFRDWTHRGGIPSHTSWGAMTYTRSQHLATARAGLEHYYLDLIADPLDNARHHRRSPEYHLGDVEVPTLCMGGWNDYFLRGTLRTYLGVAGPKRLVVGPWGHAEFTPRHEQELVRWLKFWLDGEGEDPTKGERVHLYVTGADEWKELEDWPDPASRTWTNWHPHPDQKLAESRDLDAIPATVAPFVEAIPMALNVKPALIQDGTESGMSRWGEDQVFDSEPLTEELVVEGPIGAILRIAVEDCDDVDAYARLSVVTKDDSPIQLTEGRLRASHRRLGDSKTLLTPSGDPAVPWHPHDQQDSLLPGEPFDLAIEMGAVCHRFAAGERIRLGVTLVRSDERSEFGRARIEPESRLLLPSLGPA